MGVVKVLEISRKTVRNIKQNLFVTFTFGYNSAGVLIAVAILLPNL